MSKEKSSMISAIILSMFFALAVFTINYKVFQNAYSTMDLARSLNERNGGNVELFLAYEKAYRNIVTSVIIRDSLSIVSAIIAFICGRLYIKKIEYKADDKSKRITINQGIAAYICSVICGLVLTLHIYTLKLNGFQYFKYDLTHWIIQTCIKLILFLLTFTFLNALISIIRLLVYKHTIKSKKKQLMKKTKTHKEGA